MIQVKCYTVDGNVKSFDAARILAHINDTAFIKDLVSMNWNTTGKKDFLTGKTTAIDAELAEYLSEEEAEQAIAEYVNMIKN